MALGTGLWCQYSRVRIPSVNVVNEENISPFEHLKALLAEMDLRYQQRFDAQNTAIAAALLAAEKAVSKAETAADKRFELLNELRMGVATRSDYEAQEKLIGTLSSRLDKQEGKSTGLNAGWGYLIGAIGLVSGLIGIFIALGK
jgi:hypothetical protein